MSPPNDAGPRIGYFAGMGKGRHKPTDPQELAQRRADRAANEAEIARLKDQGATVKLDRARRIVSAYRASPFVKLRDQKAITSAQASAAERLCRDWAVWKGRDGKPAALEVRSTNWSHAEFVTDRMLQAGDKVREVLDKVGPMDRDLLSALVVAAVEYDRAPAWRAIVLQVTGVEQSVRQSQTVACSLENLARAYLTH